MNPRVLILMVLFGAVVAAGVWFVTSSRGAPRESITLTGVDGRDTPVTLVLERDSELVECRSVRPHMARCMLFDSGRAAELDAAYERQLVGQGWTRTQNAPGAVDGLLVLRRPVVTETCPPVMMIIPGVEERFATGPTPAGKEFRVVAYNFDLFCRAREGRQ